jgi:quercetin dioxygenase-like cupin family protein
MDIQITRNGSQPSAKGPADWFTGTTRIAPFFARERIGARGGGARHVRAGRTHRVAHASTRPDVDRHVGSWLGAGRRRPVQEIRPGDVIWFPPGLRHWHGSTPTTAMSHIAVREHSSGKVVDWMEKVSDEQYRR